MTKFLKNIFYIISFFAALAAIIGLYFQLATPKSIIEIQNISTDKLTDLPSVDGLKAIYTFKNDTVKSLYKMHYLIENKGDATIIGEGNNKNIIHDKLKFDFDGSFRIIDYKIYNQSFPFKLVTTNQEMNISFLQWKTNESFDVILYVEPVNEESIPVLKTNEREIINGEVKHSTLYKEISKKESAFEYLPKSLQQILRWFAIICFGLVFIFCPVAFISEALKVFNYKKWKKNKYWMYSEWVHKMIDENKLDKYKEPENLPYYMWNEYPYPKPIIPTNDFKNMTVGLIFIMILTLIPILTLIQL